MQIFITKYRNSNEITMKFVILLCVLSVLLLQQAQASPVKLVERQERGLARQQATNEVAPAAVQAADEDDDDEDDDDDEPDLGDLIDDDDDEEDDDDDEDDDDEEEEDRPQGQAAPNSGADDDDEEDDDDDDYLDRLFDDILGDEDDDEDDDDDEPAASVQNTVAAAPAQPIEEIAPVGQAATAGISDGVDLPAESANANEPVAAGNAVDNEVAPSSSSNNEGALTGEDDDDADDDEDDDDDDIIGDDVIEARREARSLKNNIIEMSSDAFQERNNQFVDAIFARINRIVSDNYDPFVVQLNGRSTVKHDTKSASTASTTSTATKSQQNKIKTAKPQTTNTSIKKLKNTKSEPRSSTNNDNSNNIDNINSSTLASEESMPKDNENEPKQLNKLQQQLEQLQGQEQKKLKATEQIGNDVATNEQQKNEQNQLENTDEMKQETRTAFVNDVVKSGNQKKSSTKAHKQHGTTKKTHNGSSATNSNKQKLKSTSANNNNNKHGNSKDATDFLRAEGSLSGLASLKRVGNVKLATDPEGRNSTIKAKFTLGPLILRVEKSFKRNGVENVKSATARTNEMIGRIKFGVVNDRATLMSIKVQQPKQVEVESKDNHDRTREFVWRRTPKIAKLVNEKLKLAAETLFAPQGVEVVRL